MYLENIKKLRDVKFEICLKFVMRQKKKIANVGQNLQILEDELGDYLQSPRRQRTETQINRICNGICEKYMLNSNSPDF